MSLTTKRLLWLSDSPFTTSGYSTISTQICNRLAAKGWEVHYIAHNYSGQHLLPGDVTMDGKEWDFHVWGAGREEYCKDVIMPRIQEIKPHVFGVLLDTFMLKKVGYEQLSFHPANSVFYFPSDGGGTLPQNCDSLLRKFTLPICMSRFGQKQAKDLHDLDVHHIPHAVDSEVYKPLSKEERLELKKKYGMVGKFVVGTVARNQGRKMLDRTIKSFALFCKDKPDAVLLLQTNQA